MNASIRSLVRLLAGLVLVPLLVAPSFAAPSMDERIEALRRRAAAIAGRLWEWAELGYLEERSSALLKKEIEAEGFRVEAPVAGIPTAFVASAGRGRPVIAILGEFDALPGASQAAVPRREPRVEGAGGQACGHHLFGAASFAAAVAVKDWLAASGRSGTIRFYGTPAEEGGSGKVYMARAGLFDDVDAVLHWHPGASNDASPYTTLANRSAKFRFHGIASHAAVAPERGRSALDGVEAMNFMVNLMREHVPEAARIHYVITEGGLAPNVVPEFAEVFYYVRHPKRDELLGIWERVEAAARGAAQGTGTTVDWEIIHGNYPLLPNDTLARLMDDALRAVGGPVWDDAAEAFAAKLRPSLPADAPPPGAEREIHDYAPVARKGSTDVGDVSWLVPTAAVRVATWVPGTAPHTWQATAAGGTGIGEAGMVVAAKVLARTAERLFEEPALAQAARAELEARRGEGFVYRPLLGDRDPPLDYRVR